MATFEIISTEVFMRARSDGRMRVEFSAESADVASLLTAKQLVSHCDTDELLDAIGFETVRAWLGERG